MINNLDSLKPILHFPDSDAYYFVQILKRRKDNPNMSRDMRVMDNFFIESISHLEDVMGDIVKTCETHNARAYIRLNRRSFKKTAMQTLKRITTAIISGDYRSVKNAYTSVSGEFHADPYKKWVVDLDNISYYDIEQSQTQLNMLGFIEDLQKETGREPLMLMLPTKTGAHLITSPFNLSKFKELYPTIDIHKDATTILYVP